MCMTCVFFVFLALCLPNNISPEETEPVDAMAEGWIGKSISIKCVEPAGTVFQGTIKEVTPEVITIVRVFRNGVPMTMKKPETEVKIASANILSLELIPEVAGPSSSTGVARPTPVKQTQSTDNNRSAKNQQQNRNNKSPSNSQGITSANNGKKFFANSGPPVDFLRPTAQVDEPVPQQRGNNNFNSRNQEQAPNGNGNGKNGRRYQNPKETFGTPVNDPTMDEDFDFEKNLALFDKQAVWEKIDHQLSGSKPDLLHHQGSGQNSYGYQRQQHQSQPKYRHDENILQSAPTQYRQIVVDYNSSRDYVSDDGLIVPSIPLIVRNRIQTAAEAMGLTWERQIELLSRGTCDTALQLLGGAPRLKPNNKHQWPNIVVLCEEPYNERKSEIGICTGRMLATHGLKVVVYVRELTGLSRMSYELDLFKATGNKHTCEIRELPSSPDLIIISSRMSQLAPDISKWVAESRSPVLAIDPPVGGFVKIQAKCSILPILPLDDINMNACGKLYLCNLCIPDKFFHDAGIRYSSPFGHKHVIPIHTCD